MLIVILLGPYDEYLDYRKFQTQEQVDQFAASIEDLLMANIEGQLPLQERLKLAPSYFPFAGCVQDFEVIDLNEEKGEAHE